MGSKTPLVLTALIAVAGCETVSDYFTPPLSEAERNCPAVGGYSRQHLERSQTYLSGRSDEELLSNVAASPMPGDAPNALNRLRVRMSGRPSKQITYWRDEETGLWNIAGNNTYAFYSASPPPPPPPPPGPEAFSDPADYEAFLAAEEARLERERNRPPPPDYRTLTAEASARIDELFFDPCVASGPDHLPGYFDLNPFWQEDGDDMYVCPPDGNTWVGEIVLNGAAPRYVSSGCRNEFALSLLLGGVSYPASADLIPLGPEYD